MRLEVQNLLSEHQRDKKKKKITTKVSVSSEEQGFNIRSIHDVPQIKRLM